MPPSLSVPVALILFVIAVFASFGPLGARRAVIASLIGGTLLLPAFDVAFPVPILAYKATFVPGVVLLASALLDGGRWQRLRPSLLDLPMAVVCLVPLASSMSNGLGAYDGVHEAFHVSMLWGAPYLLGRVYLGDAEAQGELAWALVIAALLYVPLCAWELRMSPQLHYQLYGFSTGNWADNVRTSGWRPKVFMNHGLMLALFMSTSTLVAAWLWRTGTRRAIWSVPLGAWCLVLAGITLLTRSAGAIVLGLAGYAVLELTRRFRTAAFLVAVLAVPAVYCTARVSGWSGKSLVELAEEQLNTQRSSSLAFRFENEDLLIEKALQRPVLGWGGWGRSFIRDEEGKNLSVTDGLWIIVLGTNGAIGLVALGLSLALPIAALLRTFPARHWGDPRLASVTSLAVACLLFAVDSLFNAMPTPLFPAAIGGLASFSLAAAARRLRRRPTAPARSAGGPQLAPRPEET